MVFKALTHAHPLTGAVCCPWLMQVIYTETVSNPTLVVADIPALAELAHARGIKLVVSGRA